MRDVSKIIFKRMYGDLPNTLCHLSPKWFDILLFGEILPLRDKTKNGYES